MQTASETSKEKAPKKNEWHWFVEPLDAHTNEVIARLLVQKDENAMELRDDGGKVHKVWACPPEEAIKMRRSAKTQKLNFNVYMKYNGNPLKLCRQPEKELGKFRKGDCAR